MSETTIIRTKVERIVQVQEGRDCRTTPCGRGGCGTGSNHGVADATWFYAVSDGEVAAVLSVSSNRWPKDLRPCSVTSRIDPQRRITGAYGAQLLVHTAFPTDRSMLRQEQWWGEDACEFLGGKHCTSGDARWGWATEFFERYGVDALEQPESFWLALERETALFVEQAHAARVDLTHRRCDACKGEGVVAIEPPMAPAAAPVAEPTAPIDAATIDAFARRPSVRFAPGVLAEMASSLVAFVRGAAQGALVSEVIERGMELGAELNAQAPCARCGCGRPFHELTDALRAARAEVGKPPLAPSACARCERCDAYQAPASPAAANGGAS